MYGFDTVEVNATSGLYSVLTASSLDILFRAVILGLRFLFQRTDQQELHPFRVEDGNVESLQHNETPHREE